MRNRRRSGAIFHWFINNGKVVRALIIFRNKFLRRLVEGIIGGYIL